MISPSIDRPSWTTAWPDALAFAGGLIAAGLMGWQTTDLVWSLWLSSLVVGYATMAWPVIRAGLAATGAMLDRSSPRLSELASSGPGPLQALVAIGGSIGLAIAAFMTLHFVGFHVAHATLLAALFPLEGVSVAWSVRALAEAFGEIFQRYWYFLPSAFVAERSSFMRPGEPKDDGSITADAIAARKRRNARGLTIGAYRNVIRMHFLIFFFGLAHFAGLRSAIVYIVAYAAYFFPWRLLPARSTSRISAASSPGTT